MGWLIIISLYEYFIYNTDTTKSIIWGWETDGKKDYALLMLTSRWMAYEQWGQDMMQVVDEGIMFFPLALNILDSATTREVFTRQGFIKWIGQRLITHLYGSSDP